MRLSCSVEVQLNRRDEHVHRAHAQVFQGVILAPLDRFQKSSPLGSPLPAFGGKVTTPSGYLAALWVHECGRVFCDKMITHEDKAWVDGAIRDLSKCVLTSISIVMRALAVWTLLLVQLAAVHGDDVAGG